MIELITPDWPAPARVRSLQTTRCGGVSLSPYDSLNLGLHVGDDREAVEANRALLGAQLPSEPLWLEQVHGTRVVEMGAGEASLCADAVVCRQPGRVGAIMTADCLPVLFCNQEGSVVGAAHAGWRGLLAGVLENTLVAMAVPEQTILAWLGPAIGPDVFEVGAEVRAAFLERDAGALSCFKAAEGEGKYFADIYALARRRLQACGIEAIHGGGACTFSDRARYYSYRRDGRTGRMASLIWLDDV